MNPTITLALLSYNQVGYLDDAISGCFSQDCEPIEILLSDDASSDGSYELLQARAASYFGPHRVRVRRNDRNLGIGAHYNAIIAAAQGELIVTAAGDDVSLPHRVAALAKAWRAGGCQADLIASHLVDMHPDGRLGGVIAVDDLAAWTKPEDWTRKRPYVVGASHAFTKRLHSRFGPFSDQLTYEDQVMALRACCMGGAVTVKQALLHYRRGGVSSRNEGASASTYRMQLHKKHIKQKALFQQIRADLERAGLGHLWRGKVARYLHRSELALRLLNMTGWAQRFALAWRSPQAGWWWGFRLSTQLAWLDHSQKTQHSQREPD